MAQILRTLLLAAVLWTGIAPALAQSPTPVPPLPDTERRTTYTITASKCSCAVGFALYGDGSDYQNWIEVWINGVRAPYNDGSVGWTLTSPTIGSFSSAARPITDAVITFNSVQTGTVQIVGARKPRRVSQYSESRGVPARNLNQDLTDIIAQNRETWDKINDVTGRAVLAPPGETLNVLATATARANSGACFDANGQLVACVSVPSTTFTAGNGITITGTSPKTITNNIAASGPITITGTNPLTIGCPTCNTSPAAATPAIFVSSRSAATALNLSTYSVVRTGGYAAAGDGGGALFKNIGSASFQDSFVTGGSLTAPGSSYTNGTYRGVPLTGGTGSGITATLVVAGNVVTSVTVTGTGGNGYTVGDVLSAPVAYVGGTGSGFTWTVSSVSTASGSFTDSAGTHFQIIADGYINVRQFGAVMNYTAAGGDGSATNDQVAIQNALSFAGGLIGNVAAGGIIGQTVLVPAGAAKVCGGLVVPNGVTFTGVGPVSSLLKQCDSDAATMHFVTLCDPATLQACFGVSIREIQLFGGSGAANGNIAMIYTNSAQQLKVISNVAVYAIKRMCLFADTGYGGAANFVSDLLFCTAHATSTQSQAIAVTYGAAAITLTNTIVESGGAYTGSGILINTGGSVNITGWHSENVDRPIFVNLSGGSTTVQIFQVTGGSNCTSVVTRQGGSTANATIVGRITPNGCTNAINNAGTTTTGLIVDNTKI